MFVSELLKVFILHFNMCPQISDCLTEMDADTCQDESKDRQLEEDIVSTHLKTGRKIENFTVKTEPTLPAADTANTSIRQETYTYLAEDIDVKEEIKEAIILLKDGNDVSSDDYKGSVFCTNNESQNLDKDTTIKEDIPLISRDSLNVKLESEERGNFYLFQLFIHRAFKTLFFRYEGVKLAI